MRVIEPMIISDAVLAASNIPENDHPVWDIATSYTAGQRVILPATHRIYAAVSDNLGQTPAGDDGTYWVDTGATNRWRAFDGVISDPAVRTGNITYTLAPSEIVDGIAFLGLNASAVRVVVKDSGAATIYDQSIALVDRTEQVDWFAWLFDPISFETEAMLTGFPGYVGNTLEITITSTAARVGQIVTGRVQALGTALAGTNIGFIDYSRKERDDFGRPVIVQRDIADRTEFQFSFPPEDARRVKRIAARLRAVPAVYYADNERAGFGTTVYGFNSGIEVPLTAGRCFATMEVEGLV